MTTEITSQEEQILKQGIETIAVEGVRFFTVESLAAKLGMSKKTIYKFFPTKEILLERIVDFFTGLMARKFRSIIASRENPVLKFVTIMEFILSQIGRFSMEKVAEIKNRYPILWNKIEEFRLERIEDFYAILSECQQQGYVRSTIDVHVAATLYMNIINSTFQPEFFIKNNLAPRDAVKTFVRMITEGLFTGRGVQSAREYEERRSR
ncbi:MAG: TetR/AcrR family transcriptional regulator [Fidelibacterota bacterium]